VTVSSASQQIEAIHEMMSTGHKSVRIESHTLVIWGVTAAVLILFVDDIFSHQNISDPVARALSMNLFIASILTLVGIIESRMTRSKRDARDESLSFVQMQLSKVWWLILGLIVIINLAMQFFGGGYMLYSLTMALMGMALYIQGLFSRQMLAWAGVGMILLGLVTLATKLPLQLIEWIAVFCFGIGWPLLAWAINHQKINKSMIQRLIFTLIWLAVIIIPAYAVTLLASEPDYELVKNTISLNDYKKLQKSPEKKQIISLPAGTVIPVNLNIGGGLVNVSKQMPLILTLATEIKIEVQNGSPTGRFKLKNTDWKIFKYDFRLRITRFLSSLKPKQGPGITVDTRIVTKD